MSTSATDGQAATIRTIFETSLRHLPELYGPLEQLLPKLDIPTQIVWGDRDPFFTIESGRRTANVIADARLTTLQGAGHFLPAERPAEMFTAVKQLLVRVERQRKRVKHRHPERRIRNDSLQGARLRTAVGLVPCIVAFA